MSAVTEAAVLEERALAELTDDLRPVVRELAVPAQARERIPRVVLVDAAAAARAGAAPADLREDALRAWSRQFSAHSGASHSSRSYRLPLALLAWHEAPVGVDIERVGPCDDAFAASIQTPRERATLAADDRDRAYASLWCSKEALAKALGDPLAYDPRRLEGPQAWPQGRSGPWCAAPLNVGSGHVAWICWRVV